MDSLGVACPRAEIIAGCSAVVTLINDYATLRRKVKEVKDDN